MRIEKQIYKDCDRSPKSTIITVNNFSALKMHHLIIFCATASLSTLLTVQCEQPLLRQTVNGPVEGVEMNTTFGLIFYAFKSIPYASPPITGRDPYTGKMVDRRFKVR